MIKSTNITAQLKRVSIHEADNSFLENNQVYLKNNTDLEELANDEWFPINFQWKPIVELNENLINR